MALTLREADAADAAVIAEIQARSWQSVYRGIMPDAYLDGPALADLQAKWHGRMTAPADGQQVWCADSDGQAVGFLCALRADATPWGALVDNLHLLPAARGHGAGKRLMGEAARWAIAQGITQLHLLVYEGNAAAIGFYEALGGVMVNRGWQPGADGQYAWVLTYHWPEIAALAALR
ncbi:GNAT family N-acetyltransferase [uncultured Ralstonia sp.]|jgi:ribosomal protein S18 acetylase RimI-like enzyme|uniref:GNAT family N-acetyltransferase n=1 Tax=uncultured Ralstonia sp. TaxID=114715 RepID=UPI001EAA0F3E|nr:GNAT family N-acetyltransferase [uncultured Ralstonia sp.]UCF23410.1 MAG: GNAT family N-acetyltransferase [Ralstonia sp.]